MHIQDHQKKQKKMQDEIQVSGEPPDLDQDGHTHEHWGESDLVSTHNTEVSYVDDWDSPHTPITD